jgi:hypothetical protein
VLLRIVAGNGKTRNKHRFRESSPAIDAFTRHAARRLLDGGEQILAKLERAADLIRRRSRTTMKKRSENKGMPKMDAEAFAGFLRLWITPPGRDVRPSPEVEAYLRYVAEHSPLTPAGLRTLGSHTDRAA